MTDEPFYTPGLNVPKPQWQPGEKLFEFLRGHGRFLCELRDHGQWGIEAQFFQNEELLIGRRFDTRDLAIQWAELEAEAIKKDGA